MRYSDKSHDKSSPSSPKKTPTRKAGIFYDSENPATRQQSDMEDVWDDQRPYNHISCEPAAIAGCRDPKTGEEITVKYINDWIKGELAVDPAPMDDLVEQVEKSRRARKKPRHVEIPASSSISHSSSSTEVVSEQPEHASSSSKPSGSHS